MLSILCSLAMAGWQHDAATGAAAMAAASPDLAGEVAAWEPSTTRSGHKRFVGPYSHDPRLTPLFLHRLAEGQDSEAVRTALVEAVSRQKGEGYSEALPDLALHDAQATVRAVAVESLRGVDRDVSGTLTEALADPVSGVREAAARTLGRVGDASAVPALIPILADSSPEVRAAAARSLGTLRDPQAFEALVGLLDDEHADVRLETLHALERVAPADAPYLSQLDELSVDDDARVARAATALMR